LKAINKNMTFDEIFSTFEAKFEEIAECLSNYGLHCVGCPSSRFESIEQGLLAHGFDESQIEDVLDKLNKIIKQN